MARFLSQRVTYSSLMTFGRRYGWAALVQFFYSDLRRQAVTLTALVDDKRVTCRQPMEPWAFHHAVDSWPKLVRLAKEATSTPGNVILDVGANVGVFAAICHSLDPTAEIHCFEPGRTALGFLEDNCGGKVTIVQCAAGAEAGELEFHESVASQSSGLIAPKNKRGWTSYKVRIVTLADYIETINPEAGKKIVLKVDVQGTEDQVIDGLGGHLDKVSIILLESTWLDEGSIRIALKLVDSGWKCTIAHTLQGGADLILNRSAKTTA